MPQKCYIREAAQSIVAPVIGNYMKTLITILLFIGLCKSSFGCCALDDRSLTEILFQGQPGTIFTCKVLTFSRPTNPNNIQDFRSDGSIDGTATAEIITVYFGKVDTNIVTLRAGSNLTVGLTYLIYTSGSGRVFGFGGNCDRRSKQVTDIPETINELLILKQFSDIFKNKTSGRFTFTNSKNIIVAKGKFKQGKPIKTWQHYYDNGNIKNLSTQVNINRKDGGSYSTGKSGEYKEYYENGNLKLQGNYKTGKRIGLWRWYHENGDFKTEFDYKDGVNEMNNTDNTR
jgi:hypothetical protein